MSPAVSRVTRGLVVTCSILAVASEPVPALGDELEEQRLALLKRIEQIHHPTDAQMKRVREIFAGSPRMGQGNPAVTHHAATTEACRKKLAQEGVVYENPLFERLCGAKYMAPLYDPAREGPKAAKACIDQFEFPDIPCDYPVVWVRAKEAAELCAALGKRVCDAHEWEGACEGRLLAPDYDLALAKGRAEGPAQTALGAAHNRRWAPKRSWSYGPQFKQGVCAQSSTKDAACNGGQWETCGSNHYPVGFFPGCKSPLGVSDLNGNAAEHMNLPLAEDQLASRGSTKLGVCEMKGSWFIWDSFQAHPDWCRWRAPSWHFCHVTDADSHRNYHLGFRCCKTLEAKDGVESTLEEGAKPPPGPPGSTHQGT